MLEEQRKVRLIQDTTVTPSAMNQMGWTRNSLKPGDVITVYMFQAKTGNPVGRINKIVLADGTTLRDSTLGQDVPSR